MKARGKDVRGSIRRIAAALSLASIHLRREGVAVAAAWIAQRLLALSGRARRDPGERAAERFMRSLGYTVLARNWRSPRDPRDEADLVVASPDGADIVIVEVKRTASTWDPLARVDGRKRSVLWRILRDLEDLRLHASDRALRRAIARSLRIRIDLVGVRGEGLLASVVDYAPDTMQRELERTPSRPRDGAAQRGPPARQRQ
jgi:Holliday junction resolvase-like predicted endonuclease